MHTPRRNSLNKESAGLRDHYLHNTQQIQETNIHAPSGIRTLDPNNQAASDIHLRLLHGNHDQGKIVLFYLFSFLHFYDLFQCSVVYVSCNVLRGIRLLPKEIQAKLRSVRMN